MARNTQLIAPAFILTTISFARWAWNLKKRKFSKISNKILHTFQISLVRFYGQISFFKHIFEHFSSFWIFFQIRFGSVLACASDSLLQFGCIVLNITQTIFKLFSNQILILFRFWVRFRKSFLKMSLVPKN